MTVFCWSPRDNCLSWCKLELKEKSFDWEPRITDSSTFKELFSGSLPLNTLQNWNMLKKSLRFDIFQVCKWLNLPRQTRDQLNINYILHWEGAVHLWPEEPEIFNMLDLQEAWTQLEQELNNLGFACSNENIYLYRTASCLWLLIRQNGDCFSEKERLYLWRIARLANVSQAPLQLLKRMDFLVHLPCPVLLLIAIILFSSTDEIMEYYEFLLEHRKREDLLDWICLKWDKETRIHLENHLQQYLDKTGDVQTVVWLSLELIDHFNEKSRVWITEYRRVLEQRALFPVLVTLDTNVEKKTSDMDTITRCLVDKKAWEAVCYFCNKSFEYDSFVHSGSRQSSFQMYPGSFGSKSFVTSQILFCPFCKNELPKCCICLQSLSCWNPSSQDTSSYRKQDGQGIVGKRDSSQIGHADWNGFFTWCLQCRHGGHVEHMMEWFCSADSNRHLSCPVSGCSCHCWKE